MAKDNDSHSKIVLIIVGIVVVVAVIVLLLNMQRPQETRVGAQVQSYTQQQAQAFQDQLFKEIDAKEAQIDKYGGFKKTVKGCTALGWAGEHRSGEPSCTEKFKVYWKFTTISKCPCSKITDKLLEMVCDYAKAGDLANKELHQACVEACKKVEACKECLITDNKNNRCSKLEGQQTGCSDITVRLEGGGTFVVASSPWCESWGWCKCKSSDTSMITEGQEVAVASETSTTSTSTTETSSTDTLQTSSIS